MDEVSEPIAERELREFLEADLTGVRSDPVFRRLLLEKLWAMVEEQAKARREASPPAASGCARRER